MDLERLVVTLAADITLYVRALEKANAQTRSFSSSVQQSLRRVEMAFHSVGNVLSKPILGAGSGATDAFGEFNQRMTESTSIMSGVTSEIRAEMEKTAKSLSMEGKQSASELAQAFYFLASAGLETKDALKALPVVQNFATAGNFDLAKATTIATDAQAALGMVVRDNKNPIQEAAQNMANLTRITDVLVKADSIANASVQQFGVALTHQAGAAAKSFGKDLEETVAVLAAFASQGIKAELAGNTFSRLLRVLSYSAIKHSAAYEQLGVKVYDANGKMRNTADVIQNLERVLEPMSDELRTATLKSLGFEIRLQQAILPLMGTSDAIREFETRLRKAGGTAKEVAQKQLLSFNNQMQMVKNTMNVLAIETGEILAPALETLGMHLKEATLWVQNLAPETKTAIVSFLAMGAALTTLTALVMTAGVAFTFLMGTVGWIAVPLVAGILAASAAFASWVHDVGGLTAAFDILSANAQELWTWLLPIRRAMNGILSTSWGTLRATFWDLVGVTREWWASLTGGQFSWDALQAKIVDGLIYLEFGIMRFKDVFRYAWLSIKLAAVSAINWVIGKWDEFASGGWTKVNAYLAEVWARTWMAMMRFSIDNLVTFMGRAKKIQALFVAGFFSETARDLLSKELNDFAKDAMEKLPKALQIDLPPLNLNKLPQQLKDAEATIRKEWEALGGALGGDFAKFRDKRLKEINEQVAEAVAKGKDPVDAMFGDKVNAKGWGLGKNLGEAIGGGMKSALPSVDNVLFGSNEALRRLEQYNQLLGITANPDGSAYRAPKKGKGSGPSYLDRIVPLQPPSSSVPEDSDNMVVVLKDIRSELQKGNRRVGVNLEPADLTV